MLRPPDRGVCADQFVIQLSPHHSRADPYRVYGNQLGICASAVYIGNAALARRKHASDCASHARGGAAAGLRRHIAWRWGNLKTTSKRRPVQGLWESAWHLYLSCIHRECYPSQEKARLGLCESCSRGGGGGPPAAHRMAVGQLEDDLYTMVVRSSNVV